ncbi:unnamed protein product, partial [Rotaria sordida]
VEVDMIEMTHINMIKMFEVRIGSYQ